MRFRRGDRARTKFFCLMDKAAKARRPRLATARGYSARTCTENWPTNVMSWEGTVPVALLVKRAPSVT